MELIEDDYLEYVEGRRRGGDDWENILEKNQNVAEDVFQRPDCCNTIQDTCESMLPLYYLNKLFPVRYFTSWYRVLVILYVCLYLLEGSWPNPNGPIAGGIWILSVQVPLASSIIYLYAQDLLDQLKKKGIGVEIYLYHHFLMHLVPAEVVFLLTPLPNGPAPFVSTAFVLALMFLYALLLYVFYAHTFLSNYYILKDEDKKLAVMLLWCLCIVFACALMEFLFAAHIPTAAVHPPLPKQRATEPYRGLEDFFWRARNSFLFSKIS
jgi:hypothetical protein